MIFKLLIVDDETTIRKGISEYMNWESIDCVVVGTASNGAEAISFLQTHAVDIIITDIKMPKADGLAVAKYVYENHQNLKVIILTGYADFEYAKIAITYNVNAFILKPTSKKELFEAVQSAQKELITSKKYTEIAKEELAFLKEQCLQDLTDQPYRSDMSARLQKYDITLKNYYVAAFQFIPFSNDLTPLKNIIIKEKPHNAFCYRYNDLMITVYYFENMDSILDNCKEIASITQALESRRITIGISNHHTSPEEYSQSVSEAISALSLNFYQADNIAVFSDTQITDYDLTVDNSLELFQFENHLMNWQFEDASKTLRNLFARFKQNLIDAQDAKNICSQIYYICSRITFKERASQIPSDYLEQITTSSDIFTLENTCINLFLYLRDQLLINNNTQQHMLNQIDKYIDENIASDLSLNAIASHMHISASYLSRIFKKETGYSLSDYINMRRIEKAKKLLLHTDIYTYVIAEMVGYNDATYFSSIFKKYEGVSPSQFRAGTNNRTI